MDAAQQQIILVLEKLKRHIRTCIICTLSILTLIPETASAMLCPFDYSTSFTHHYTQPINRFTHIGMKADGSISTWGSDESFLLNGTSGAPPGPGYVSVVGSLYAHTALHSNGNVYSWGASAYGGTGAPSSGGFVEIQSTQYAFAALRDDGRVFSWGDPNKGGSGAPTDTGYVAIYSNLSSFAALKEDGSISSWGTIYYAADTAPPRRNQLGLCIHQLLRLRFCRTKGRRQHLCLGKRIRN